MKQLHSKDFPKVIVIDWDETITSVDTIELVAQAAYKRKPHYQPPFDYFVKIYYKAYEKYVAEFYSKNGPRDTIRKEYDFQLGLKDVEMSSINEICDRGLFKGLRRQDFESQARYVKLRDGFKEFMRACQLRQIRIIILSINWTKLIMKKVLENEGLFEGDHLEFIVNEFEFHDGVTTGIFAAKTIGTGVDKVNVVKQLRTQYGSLCYIGDSATDLLLIIESDIGIAYKDSKVLNCIEELQILPKLLNEIDHFDSSCIYVADWHEILGSLNSTG